MLDMTSKSSGHWRGVKFLERSHVYFTDARWLYPAVVVTMKWCARRPPDTTTTTPTVPLAAAEVTRATATPACTRMPCGATQVPLSGRVPTMGGPVADGTDPPACLHGAGVCGVMWKSEPRPPHNPRLRTATVPHHLEAPVVGGDCRDI